MGLGYGRMTILKQAAEGNYSMNSQEIRVQSPSKYSTTNSQTLNFFYQPRHCLVIFNSCPSIPPQEVHGLFICHDVVNLNFISFLKSLIVFYAKNYMIIKIMIVI